MKDDAGFVDAIMDKVYAEMIAFDSERAETVMELTVKRKPAAKHLFKDLLEDIQDFSIPQSSPPSGSTAPARG